MSNIDAQYKYKNIKNIVSNCNSGGLKLNNREIFLHSSLEYSYFNRCMQLVIITNYS